METPARVTAVPDSSRAGEVLEILVLAAVTVACLLPFAGKAFHVDDPLFVWNAQQIQSRPFDFYGFSVNWYGTVMPMHEITKNPPLACYYLAMIGTIANWREATLHLAFILPALAAALGTYALAKRLCNMPLAAALMAVLTPVFLVSATTVMCDVMMLAFWCWAVVFWLRGIEDDRPGALVLAGVLIALATLTKYYGVCLIPLLAAHGLIRRRRPGVWMFSLLIPVALLAAYQILTRAMYGHGLFLDATGFALGSRRLSGVGMPAQGATALVFTGGCLLTLLFAAPLVWSRRALILGAGLAVVFAVGVGCAGSLAGLDWRGAEGIRWGLLAHVAVFAAAGIGVLALGLAELLTRRDASAWLLALWVWGTFVFTGLVNWMVNGRSILPAAPAVAILLVRRIQQRSGAPVTRRPKPLYLCLVAALLVSLAVAWADQRAAGAARTAAAEICRRYGQSSRPLQFQGHWGFQYYMESRGARALDMRRSALEAGDVVVIPRHNIDIHRLPPESLRPLETLRVRPAAWITTVSPPLGVNFYAARWGPLPWAVGRVPKDPYHVLLVREPLDLSRQARE